MLASSETSFPKGAQKAFAAKRLRSSGGPPSGKIFELPRQPFSFFQPASHPEYPQSSRYFKCY